MRDKPNEPRSVIAPLPPRDGFLWESQCARCGSSVDDNGLCLSTYLFCRTNPLPGRDHVKGRGEHWDPGQVEWYQVAEL